MTTATLDWDLVDAAAQSAGVPYFTRRKWRDRNRVPVHWWPALETASGGKLTSEDFQKLVPPANPNPASEGEAA